MIAYHVPTSPRGSFGSVTLSQRGSNAPPIQQGKNSTLEGGGGGGVFSLVLRFISPLFDLRPQMGTLLQ